MLDFYLAEHVDSPESSVVAKDRQHYGARHVRNALGGRSLRSIDIPACRAYVRERRLDAAPSTIRRELNILTAAANLAKRWRKISADDMPEIELPDAEKATTVEWLTKEQVASMFRECNTGILACYIRILYYTAARRRSIETMLKAQVDRTTGLVHLAKEGERVTKKRRPTVPLYDEMRPAVDWLFDNIRGPYLFGADYSMYRRFVALARDCGFEAHPHMMRHSRATHMLMDNEPLYRVARLLGDSLATVERVYGHHSVGFLATQSKVHDGDFTAQRGDATPYQASH